MQKTACHGLLFCLVEIIKLGAFPHEDVTPLWAPTLLSSAGTGAHVEHGGCWSSSPSWPAASVPSTSTGCTQETLNVKIPGRGTGRKQQQYGLKQLNVVFHQCGGQLLAGKGRGLY